MPELPEVETSCAGIRPHLLEASVSNVIVRETRLRWPVEKNLKKILTGKKLKAVSRRAKYIILHFEKSESQVSGVLVIHLGMSGSLRVLEDNIKHKKHDHLDIVFNNNKLLRFHDPRRFGAVLWIEDELNQHKLFKHLGPEPLSDYFSGEYLYLKSRKRKLSIKQFIMDAQIVVGVGNIYANEALFAAGIHPNIEAGSLTKKRAENLVNHIKQILAFAIAQGGTSLKDFESPEGKPGYFAQKLKVYGKRGTSCPKCQNVLQEIRLNNRSTVFCQKCQK